MIFPPTLLTLGLLRPMYVFDRLHQDSKGTQVRDGYRERRTNVRLSTTIQVSFFAERYEHLPDAWFLMSICAD